jgi:dihydroflavonol-4-reductase
MKELVLVTGANGYIAGMLIRELLEQGYKVRGTVRDVTSKSKTASLKALPNASMNLELVNLELTGPQEPFDEAMKDVEWVMHTASPVNLQKVKDDNELIRPAVEGTLSMLRAAHKTPTVKKFVMTSSVAAIASGHAGQETFTEDDWSNLVDGSYVSAYDKSKTKAEAAWEFMDNHDTQFTLSTINPSVVLGPVMSGNDATIATTRGPARFLSWITFRHRGPCLKGRIP